MVIAGAGGHALEILDVLIIQGKEQDLFFYDDITLNTNFKNVFPIIKNKVDLKRQLQKDPKYLLGVGDSKDRKYFDEIFKSLGGTLAEIRASSSIISSHSSLSLTDVFNLCFIGSGVFSDRGTLINTGSQIHHEVSVGEFTSINPGAILLGRSQVGSFCSVGSGAVILPEVKIGNNVIVGAGTVVTKNVPDNCTIVGVPGKIIKTI